MKSIKNAWESESDKTKEFEEFKKQLHEELEILNCQNGGVPKSNRISEIQTRNYFPAIF